MKAMVVAQPGPIESSPLQWREWPAPVPGEHEVRLRIEACGICRTDLHVIEGDLPFKGKPLVPGHQAVGTVDACGKGVQRFRLGDRAGIAWLRWTCGTCRYCASERENLCPNARFSGYDVDGGFAEYAIIHENFAYAIPSSLDAAEATPLLCAGIIGYRALRRADVTPGCRLGLYGFGSSAHIAIQVGKHWGCRVFVVTREPRHQALARELGAEWAGGSGETPPEKLDSAVLFAPVGELVPIALEALDLGGTLSVAGIHLTDIPALNYQRHLFHEKTVRSVTANTRSDGEELLRLAAQIPLRPRITRFPMSDANVALQRLKHDRINGSGVLVAPDNR